MFRTIIFDTAFLVSFVSSTTECLDIILNLEFFKTDRTVLVLLFYQSTNSRYSFIATYCLKTLKSIMKLLKDKCKNQNNTSVMIIGHSLISLFYLSLSTLFKVCKIEPGFKVFTTFNRYYLSF